MGQTTFQQSILCRMPVPFLAFQMYTEPSLVLKAKLVYSATIGGHHTGYAFTFYILCFKYCHRPVCRWGKISCASLLVKKEINLDLELCTP